jgi:hypothetical protein
MNPFFISDLQGHKKKKICSFLFEGNFSKIKGLKKVTKQKKSRIFYHFLLVDGKIQEAQKHTDPHPEHYMKV